MKKLTTLGLIVLMLGSTGLAAEKNLACLTVGRSNNGVLTAIRLTSTARGVQATIARVQVFHDTIVDVIHRETTVSVTESIHEGLISYTGPGFLLRTLGFLNGGLLGVDVVGDFDDGETGSGVKQVFVANDLQGSFCG